MAIREFFRCGTLKTPPVTGSQGNINKGLEYCLGLAEPPLFGLKAQTWLT
jgi:hypothetical protein